MKRTVRIAVISISAGLLAGGCSESVSIDDATTAIDEIDTQMDNVVSYINDILSLEEGMQEEFEEDLSENASDLFSERQADVFSNLEERESHLAGINDAAQTLQVENEIIGTVLEDGEQEELPLDELEQLHEQVDTLHNELDTYVEQYGAELQSQDDFFTGLGEDNDFEFLADGIEAINDSKEDYSGQLETIHSELLTVDSALAAINATEENDENQEGGTI